MALNIKRPNGTEDMLPSNAYKWQSLERILKDAAAEYGFKEIRIPTFEHTELFHRSVGETTDVVQKEMYKVIAKETEFTLRPEGTAGTIRAMLQNGLLNEALPQKVYYILSCFRHERPQAGRLREFHQFGIEMAGSQLPAADAEIISMANLILKRLNIENIELKLNSIGCPKCRAEYQQALKEYFEAKKEELCETCHSRLEKNPMRILDCKSPICSEIAQSAPLILDYLCDECKEHFESLKTYLDKIGIKYTIDPKIVRGLDYYTKTVFEFVSKDIGAQGTICGGGRYDGLIGQLGGHPTPALGFAMGLERVMAILEKNKYNFEAEKRCMLYIAVIDKESVPMAMKISSDLREKNMWSEFDIMGRSLKAQMKYANKLGAEYVIVLGNDEIETQSVKIKCMSDGKETVIPIDDSSNSIVNFFNMEFYQSIMQTDKQLRDIYKKNYSDEI